MSDDMGEIVAYIGSLKDMRFGVASLLPFEEMRMPRRRMKRVADFALDHRHRRLYFLATRRVPRLAATLTFELLDTGQTPSFGITSDKDANS